MSNMANWTQIECGFDSANETINFGTRNLAEGDILSETNTLAVLRTDCQVHKDPQVQCLNRNKKLFLVIDNTFRILTNNCYDVLSFRTFECPIDAFAVSSDDNLVVLCLNDGSIHCLHVLSDGKLVCSAFVPEQFDNKCFISIFACTNKIDEQTFLICTKNNSYRLQIKEVQVIYSKILESEPLLEEVKFSFEKLHSIDAKSEVIHLTYENNNYYTTSKYKKCFDTFDPFILVLKEDGKLIEICKLTNLQCDLYNEELYNDLIFLKSFDIMSHQLLTYRITSNNDAYISLLSYPNFEQNYEAKVSKNSYLVTSSSDEDEVMFIEGFCTHGSDYVNELRLKVITESVPEVKLQRLLAKKLFEDAKKFAGVFNLSMEPIFKAEAEEFIIESDFQISDIEAFRKILDSITDIAFVVECCLDCKFNTLAAMENMLEYANKRVYDILQNNPENISFLKLKSTILKTVFKLDTFKVLYSNEDFLTSAYIIDTWINFSNADLFTELCNYLKNGKIDKCTLIFNRLHQEIDLDITQIQTILSAIPVQVPLMELLPFYRYLLTYSIKNLTICVPKILLQIHNTIIDYDINKADGLNYALNFAAHIQTFLYTAETENLSLHKFNLEGGCLSKFKTLINCLNEMMILKNEFSLKITVEAYMRKPENVINLLLDKIMLSRLKEFLDQFLFVYCSNNNLNSDEVLSDYIKKTSSYQQGYWEETVSCLASHINSNSTRMEVVLHILESAAVPWSGIIEKIANKAAKESHPLADKIKIKRENIPWKILLKKYSFLEKPNYNNDDIIMFIRRILLLAKPEVLEDLNAVLARYPHLKDNCSILAFNNFIQNGKPAEALQYIDKLSNHVLLRSFKFVLLLIQNSIFAKFCTPDYIRNHLDILSSLLFRLEKSLPEYEYNIYKTEALKLKNMYLLKHVYNCEEITSKNFDLSSLIPKLVSEKIQSVEDNKITWETAVRQCVCLSHLLGVEKEQCLLELAKQKGNLEGLNHCAEIMLECDSSPLNMCAMATNIMLNLDNNDNTEQDDLVSIAPSINTKFDNNKGQVVTSLRLVNELAITACRNADYLNLSTTLTLLNWTSVCNRYKTNMCIPPKYAPEYSGGLTPGTTKILKELFSIFVRIAGPKLNYAVQMNPEISDAQPLEEQFKNYLPILSEKILQLHVEGCDLIAYQVLHVFRNEFLWASTDPDFINYMKESINSILRRSCVTPLLDKNFAAKTIDLEFTLALCLTPKFQAMKWILAAIKKYKSNPKKLNAVANLGCCDLLIMPEEMKLGILDLKNRCHWWQKFLHQCVSYNDTFQLDVDKILTEYLFKSEKFSLSLLKQFCNNFKLNAQKILPLYLKYILINWKPNVEFIQVPGSHETLQVHGEENGPYEKCKEIIALMKNKEGAIEQLNVVWNKISYYQYEVYLCILDLLEYLEQKVLHPEMKFLLIFLKSYLRIRKPQQKEIDDWQSKYPFAREIDPLSEYRLPYLLSLFTKDIWEIIRPEINLLTYDRWFETSTILQLDKDDICTYAIKGTVYSGAFNNSDTKWAVSSRNELLIKNLEICVSKITNLEVATAALYQAVCKVSGGADQVAIAKMCWRMVLLWKKSMVNDENIQEVLMKVKTKYLNCISMHILYTYNIGTKKYISLIENTEQLIRELYLDNSIIERTKATIMYYPDINAAVDQFGEQLGIDVESIRTALVMDFLLESSKNLNMDDTFCNYQSKRVEVEDDNITGISNHLKRVIYICESSQNDVWKNLLLNISFSRLDETISEFVTSPDLSMRTKALQCLSVITKESAELEELNGEPFDTYLEKLQILMTLESLGYSLSVEELNKCNKTNLIHRILRTNSSNLIIVQSLAKLSARYDIWDSNIWDMILQSFINLTMIADLQEWLPKLYKVCYTPGVDCCFVSAWDCLIRNSFLLSLRDKVSIEQGLLLIQMCPIITKLDKCLIDVFYKFVESNVFDISAILLTYIQDIETRNQMQKVLEPHISLDLFDRIKKLSSAVLNVDYAVQLLNQFHV